jgi:hypothetical protein
VVISYSIIPSENTSLRRSTGPLASCSGDMYASFPLIEYPRDISGSAATFATPKSTTFTPPP